jgi:hypothetical protein
VISQQFFCKLRKFNTGGSPAVALFRVGDLDVLLAYPAIDWDTVRSTPRSRPSPLARLSPRGLADG